MLIADRDLRLVEANALFWDAIGASEAAEAGIAIERALPEELFEGIKPALDQVLEVGTRAEVQGVRVYTAAQPHRVLDLRSGPATSGGRQVLILLADAVPDTGRPAGTYYLGVSGFANSGYSATAGTGDAGGSTGAYTLALRNLI